jgi:hypothetical protein
MRPDKPFIRFLFLILLILSVNSLFGQSSEKLSLVELLVTLEDKYGVSFNYLSEELSDVRVLAPQNVELKLDLKFLEQQHPLEFTFVTEKNISISYNRNLKCYAFLIANSLSPVSGVEIYQNTKILGESNGMGKVFVDSNLELSELKFYHPKYFNTRGAQTQSNAENCSIIYLFQEIQLDEILLQDYLTKGISLNTDNSIRIVPQEFGVLPGLINADVLHSLQYVPGIVNTDETIAQINVRGGTHDQNLVLWNGVRLYQTGHFFGMISAVNPLVNNTIDVYKNGSSAFFDEGVSSVINITSREHTLDYTTQFQLNFLSANASSFLELGDKSTLQLTARRSLTDVWQSPTYDRFTDKVFQNTEIEDLGLGHTNTITTEQSLQFYDASLQYQYSFDNNSTLHVDVLGIQNNLVFNEVLETNSQQKQNDFKQENFLLNLDYSFPWNATNSTHISLTSSFYKLDATNRSVSSNQVLNQLNQVTDLGLNLKNDHQLSKQFTLNTGYQYKEVGVRNDNEVISPDVIQREKRVLTTHSAITELNYTSKNEKVMTRFGLRGKYYSEFDEVRIEPRFSFSYQMHSHWRWNILAEQKNQTLTQVIDQQQDFFGLEKRRWILADENNFPIINNLQYELGLNFNKKGWLFQGSLYHKQVESISSSSQGFQNQLEFLRLSGNYEVFGVELLAQKRVNQFIFWVNFSIMDNSYDFESFDPQQFANNFEIRQSSAFGISYDSDELKLSFGGRYFSGKPTTDIDLENPILSPQTNPSLNFLSPNEANLRDYFQLNFTGSYTFNLDTTALETGLSILNLLNSNTLTNQFFRLDESGSTVENIRVRNLELTPNLFLTYRF